MTNYNQNVTTGDPQSNFSDRHVHISSIVGALILAWVIDHPLQGYSVTSQNIQVYALGLSGIAFMPVLQLLWNLYLHRCNNPGGKGGPFSARNNFFQVSGKIPDKCRIVRNIVHFPGRCIKYAGKALI